MKLKPPTEGRVQMEIFEIVVKVVIRRIAPYMDQKILVT